MGEHEAIAAAITVWPVLEDSAPTPRIQRDAVRLTHKKKVVDFGVTVIRCRRGADGSLAAAALGSEACEIRVAAVAETGSGGTTSSVRATW